MARFIRNKKGKGNATQLFWTDCIQLMAFAFRLLFVNASPDNPKKVWQKTNFQKEVEF